MTEAADRDLIDFCQSEYPRLVGALGLYCRDPDVAENLAQESMARLCLHWKKVRRMEAPEAWLYRVAMNLANSQFRKTFRERRLKAEIERELPIFTKETSEGVDIRNALSNLPRRQRTALILRYFLEFSTSETAAVMDCPEGTIKTLVHRARSELIERLGRDFSRA